MPTITCHRCGHKRDVSFEDLQADEPCPECDRIEAQRKTAVQAYPDADFRPRSRLPQPVPEAPPTALPVASGYHCRHCGSSARPQWQAYRSGSTTLLSVIGAFVLFAFALYMAIAAVGTRTPGLVLISVVAVAVGISVLIFSRSWRHRCPDCGLFLD